MKHKNEGKSRKRKVKSLGVILLTFILSLPTVSAQEAISATGGNASGSGGTASYTVGQIFYQTRTGTNGSVAEGVQQPYEISVVTGIEEVIGINLSVSAYPNPTADYLILEVDASAYFDNAQYKPPGIQAMRYQLYDMSGKLLQSKMIIGTQTTIVMSNLVPATYLLKVTRGNKEVKTFKVVKR